MAELSHKLQISCQHRNKAEDYIKTSKYHFMYSQFKRVVLKHFDYRTLSSYEFTCRKQKFRRDKTSPYITVSMPHIPIYRDCLS